MGQSGRVEETYVNVKGPARYLYRAVDSTGQTMEFLLTAQRDAAAVKRFRRKALSAAANPPPRVRNVDNNPAYPAAVEQLQAESTLRRRCRRRQCKFLNNVVEQDHRVAKQRVWLAQGYGSFRRAGRTRQGIAVVQMIWQGQRPVGGQRGCRGPSKVHSQAIWSDGIVRLHTRALVRTHSCRNQIFATKPMPVLDKLLLRKRALIECARDQLKNLSQIEHTRHRSAVNGLVNMLCAVAADTWQPKKPSLDLRTDGVAVDQQYLLAAVAI